MFFLLLALAGLACSSPASPPDQPDLAETLDTLQERRSPADAPPEAEIVGDLKETCATELPPDSADLDLAEVDLYPDVPDVPDLAEVELPPDLADEEDVALDEPAELEIPTDEIDDENGVEEELAPDVPSFPFDPCGEAGGNGADDVPMCLVSASPFEMGSPMGECAQWEEDCSNEHPQHIVSLDSYFIDQTEIRAGKYAECVAAGGCPLPADQMMECNYNKPGREQHPINCVEWPGIAAYCQWTGKRLCTEAEWEKAAAGETHQIWPWGDEWHDGWGNCPPPDCDDGFEQTAPVGSFPWAASPYGLLDQDANVMEFTNDWYMDSYYTVSPPSNPKGPCGGQGECPGNSFKSIRGTGWRKEGLGFKAVEFQTRISVRFGYPPTGGGYDDVGGRCCVSAP